MENITIADVCVSHWLYDVLNVSIGIGHAESILKLPFKLFTLLSILSGHEQSTYQAVLPKGSITLPFTLHGSLRLQLPHPWNLDRTLC